MPRAKKFQAALLSMPLSRVLSLAEVGLAAQVQSPGLADVLLAGGRRRRRRGVNGNGEDEKAQAALQAQATEKSVEGRAKGKKKKVRGIIQLAEQDH